jgi:uncharacterized protein
MTELLSKYSELIQKIDLLCHEITKKYGIHMQCKHGCASCCLNDLSMTAIEAEFLITNSKTKNKIAGEITGGECIFLKNNECQIYNLRPVVCRTQGFPLTYENNSQISICGLNFTDLPEDFVFTGSYIVNMDKVLAILNQLNAEFLKEHSDKTERIKFEEVFDILSK